MPSWNSSIRHTKLKIKKKKNLESNINFYFYQKLERVPKKKKKYKIILIVSFNRGKSKRDKRQILKIMIIRNLSDLPFISCLLTLTYYTLFS